MLYFGMIGDFLGMKKVVIMSFLLQNMHNWCKSAQKRIISIR